MGKEFGQVVLGPPGSGKSTYCRGMYEFLNSIDRPAAVVNLDPANDTLPYECAVDVCDLICMTDVAEAFDLGPNGGLIYCMEFLEANLDWLDEQLKALKGVYLLFDFPGQAELFTHHGSVTRILHHLTKAGYQLAAVHLVDSHHCSDGAKFISACLLSLATLMRMDLPTVNVLSKIDLITTTSNTHHAFDIDFYTDLSTISELLPTLPGFSGYSGELEGETEIPESEDAAEMTVSLAARRRATRFYSRFHKLHAALVDVISSYSLVSFQTLAIEDRESVERLIAVIDKANSFVHVPH